MTTRVASRARSTTRKQRIIQALTPKRIRRAQTRWRRRKQKVTKRYARFREVVRRDPSTICMECGRKVPQPKLKAHLARHDAQAAKRGETARRARRRNRPTDTAPPRRARKTAAAPPPRPQCDGTCTNSDEDPGEAEAHGRCYMCTGRKELITNFGGKHVHVPCGECGGTGKRTTTTKAPSGDTDGDRSNRPSRREAGTTAAPSVGMGSILLGLSTALGGNVWLAAAGASCFALGGLAYRHERRHGVSDHAARTGRKTSRQAARQAGCSSACMWSLRPVETCRCPCGGSTHGISHKRKAAA